MLKYFAITVDFNSHARVGRDYYRLFRYGNHVNFNSHARVGRDLDITPKILNHSEYFNSHARVGRDKSVSAYILNFSDFNSHARVGRDVKVFRGIAPEKISTHTPV